MKRWRLTLILILGMGFGAQTGPVWASGVDFSISLGYGGYVVPGRWAPLRINANQPVDGVRVEIGRQEKPGSVQGIESFPLQGLAFECPILADEKSTLVKVRLVKGGRVLREETLYPLKKIFPGHLILTLDLPAQSQQAIEQVLRPEEPVMVYPIQLGDLMANALNYDGVSGLVMVDPGPVLAPAQIEALTNWLTGGGKLVICAVRPGKRSILAELERIPVPALHKVPVGIPVGLGEIKLVPQELSDQAQLGEVGFWRRGLNLKSYADSSRLAAGSCLPYFDERGKSVEMAATQRPGSVFSGLYLFLLGWGLIATALCWLGNRNIVTYLLGFTVIAILIAVPAAGWVSDLWQRGTVVHTRAIVLPEAGGILYDSQIRLNGTGIFDFLNGSSPWGVNITLGRNDSGRLIPGEPLIWEHRLSSFQAVLREDNPDRLTLVGSLPVENGLWREYRTILSKTGPSFRDSVILESDAVYWDGNDLWLCGGKNVNPEWQKIIQLPPWLSPDESWVNRLQNLLPGKAWLFCRTSLPELDLKIQNSPATHIIIAFPL